MERRMLVRNPSLPPEVRSPASPGCTWGAPRARLVIGALVEAAWAGFPRTSCNRSPLIWNWSGYLALYHAPTGLRVISGFAAPSVPVLLLRDAAGKQVLNDRTKSKHFPSEPRLSQSSFLQ
jgi:hypothetical protein